MSLKIPCGGFKLDEKSFSLDKNDVLSIPKPLTYDYMPEGYPSKSVETVTMMEEQEVAFTENSGLMGANSPVDLEIKLGDKLTVVWDGVSYDVEVKKATFSSTEFFAFGNLGLVFPEDTTDYPFVYTESTKVGIGKWITADTATSHTIYITMQGTVYQTIDEKFLPKDVIVNIVGTDTILGNKYLLFDKTDEEIYNASNNGSTVKLKYGGGNEIQYDSHENMFWGVIPEAHSSNGITKLAVVSVENLADGWYPTETYITASKTS